MQERSFNHLLAALDPTARRLFGTYLAYRQGATEYLGTIPDVDIPGARAYLSERDYERYHLAAAKYHHEPHRAVDHLSMRRVPSGHPVDVVIPHEERPAIATDYAPAQCQYHVHGWPTGDGVELYGHYELRSDLHPVASERFDFYDRLRNHYRPDYGDTLIRGLTDLDL